MFYYLFIEGVGGNLVAIQSSRMSTYLHKNKNNDKLSSSDSKNCNSIFGTFFGKSMSFTSVYYHKYKQIMSYKNTISMQNTFLVLFITLL
jgi:cation transporter-like permease